MIRSQKTLIQIFRNSPFETQVKFLISNPLYQGFRVGIPKGSEFLKYTQNHSSVSPQNFYVYSIHYFNDIPEILAWWVSSSSSSWLFGCSWTCSSFPFYDIKPSKFQYFNVRSLLVLAYLWSRLTLSVTACSKRWFS